MNGGYPVEVKEFAQRVRFHSTAAYRVIREHFPLPSVSTLQRWTKPVDSSPGFTMFSLLALERIAQTGETPLCALMVDGVGLKLNLSYDKHKDKFNGLTLYSLQRIVFNCAFRYLKFETSSLLASEHRYCLRIIFMY